MLPICAKTSICALAVSPAIAVFRRILASGSGDDGFEISDFISDISG